MSYRFDATGFEVREYSDRLEAECSACSAIYHYAPNADPEQIDKDLSQHRRAEA